MALHASMGIESETHFFVVFNLLGILICGLAPTLVAGITIMYYFGHFATLDYLVSRFIHFATWDILI